MEIHVQVKVSLFMGGGQSVLFPNVGVCNHPTLFSKLLSFPNRTMLGTQSDCVGTLQKAIYANQKVSLRYSYT